MVNNKIKPFLLTGFFIFILSACSPQSADSDIPVLIRPVAARADTAIAERGPVVNVTRHEGITRVPSQPLTFGGIGDRFEAFHVQSGERVVKGQRLASLDGGNLIEEIDRLTESIAAMRNNPSEDRHTREREELALRHAEEDLAALKSRLDSYDLYAPSDGIITFLAQAGPGQWISPWESILYIADEGDVFVEYMGGELRVPSPLQALRVYRITAHIDGYVYDLQQIPITQEMRAHYAAHNRDVPLRFTSLGGALPLGAGTVIRIYTHLIEDALRIPINALFNSPEGTTFTYRIENGLPLYAPLAVGVRTAAFAEVIGGLSEGDEVFVRP